MWKWLAAFFLGYVPAYAIAMTITVMILKGCSAG